MKGLMATTKYHQDGDLEMKLNMKMRVKGGKERLCADLKSGFAEQDESLHIK